MLILSDINTLVMFVVYMLAGEDYLGDNLPHFQSCHTFLTQFNTNLSAFNTTLELVSGVRSSKGRKYQ